MQSYRLEATSILKLGTPVFLAQAAQNSMGFVDTVMAGSVSATDMAAVAVASSIWFPTIIFGIGVLLAMVPIIAQLNGSGRSHKIPFQFQQGFYLALALCIPIILILTKASFIIDFMDVEPMLAQKTIGYLRAVVWAVPAFLFFQLLKNLADGISLTVPSMIIGFIGLMANIPLNWIFVYGKLGAPALGGVGCGVATALVYWLMFFAMFIYIKVNKRLNKLNLFSAFYKPELEAIKRLFSLGLPVALSIFFEVTLFAVVAILIAPLGTIVVAAHQVAINFASMLFMLPMSISTAVSIRVSHQLGQKSIAGAKVSSKMGIILGLAATTVTAISTVLFRENIVLLYNNNPKVMLIAGNLMFMAAIYQYVDTIQVVAAGALRGYKDMAAILKCTFVAYWLVGVPVGYLLGMTDLIIEPIGVYGFWIGFISGLTVASILLGLRLRWIQKQTDEFQLAMAEK